MTGGRDIDRSWPGTYAEVKRCEAFGPALIRAAMAQAEREAAPGEVPYVAHRRNGQRWTIRVRGRDLQAFAAAVAAAGNAAEREPGDELVTLDLPAVRALAWLAAHWAWPGADQSMIGADGRGIAP